LKPIAFLEWIYSLIAWKTIFTISTQRSTWFSGSHKVEAHKSIIFPRIKKYITLIVINKTIKANKMINIVIKNYMVMQIINAYITLHTL